MFGVNCLTSDIRVEWWIQTLLLFLKKFFFINTHPPFDGEMFDLWKVRMKILIEANDFKIDFDITFGPKIIREWF